MLHAFLLFEGSGQSIAVHGTRAVVRNEGPLRDGTLEVCQNCSKMSLEGGAAALDRGADSSN